MADGPICWFMYSKGTSALLQETLALSESQGTVQEFCLNFDQPFGPLTGLILFPMGDQGGTDSDCMPGFAEPLAAISGNPFVRICRPYSVTGDADPEP